MIYLRISFVWRANHRDNIKADIMIHTIIFHIMIDGTLKVTAFMIVNGRLRLYIGAIATCLNLDKHHRLFIHGNDIYVTMTRFPVTCHNGIAHALKEVSRTVFTPFT